MAGYQFGFCKLLVSSLLLVSCVWADKAPAGGYDAAPAQPQATQATAPQGPAYGYDFSVGQAKDLGGHISSFSSSGGYAGGSGWSSGGGGAGGNSNHVESSYQPPSVPVQGNNNGWTATSQPNGPAYTYYYQHFPSGKTPHQGVGGGSTVGGGWGSTQVSNGWGNEESMFDGFGDFGGAAGGIGGLGVGGLLALAKGILALKPFLLFGLLLFIAIPLVFLFFPLPIITVGTPPATSRARQSATAYISSYVSQLSEKIMSNDECFESIICRIPPAPSKYQGKAKLLWEQYGKKYFTSPRVQRALDSFFDETAGRSRISKCNQKFKCPHNKYF